jgi:hypothetical protein
MRTACGESFEIETLLSPEMGMSLASAIWAQKSRDFRAHPLQMPREMDFPHPNPRVQPPLNNRYIGNFMDKRQEISGPIQRWFIIRG